MAPDAVVPHALRPARVAAVVPMLVAAMLAPSTATAQTMPPNPFAGRTLYVDPSSAAARDVAVLRTTATARPRIATRSQADWFGDWNSYSGGGATSSAAYLWWIDAFRAGIGGAAAAVILEPDALALLDCLSSGSWSTP